MIYQIYKDENFNTALLAFVACSNKEFLFSKIYIYLKCSFYLPSGAFLSKRRRKLNFHGVGVGVDYCSANGRHKAKGKTASLRGTNDGKEIVSIYSVRPVDETGEEGKQLNDLSACVMEIDTGAVDGNGSMTALEGDIPARESQEDLFREQTTVEVFVKMVVCRKFITKKICSKTGKVIYTSCRMEEDPSKSVSLHTYDLAVNSNQQMEQSVSSISTQVVAAKRRPGRPRKFPLPAHHSRSASAEEKQVKSNEEDVIASPETTETMAEESLKRTENKTDGRMESASTTNSIGTQSRDKSPFKTQIRSGNFVRKQGFINIDSRKPATLKRARGRPPRVIKKPRKYLDNYVDVKLELESANADSKEDDSKETDLFEMKNKEEENDDGDDDDDDAKYEDDESLENISQLKECPKCGKEFTTSSNCHRHIVKDRCKQSLLCGFCEKQFSTREHLEMHIDSHRDEKFPNSFRCNDCNRTYVTRNGYLKHKRQGTCYKRDVFHEDGTQGKFECDLCGTRFTTEKLLQLHKEKVHVNPSNEFKCQDCGRIFYSKLGFNKHITKKSCTEPYVCRVCGKHYSNKAKESYKSHMRYHMAEASGVQFQCEDCGRVYMTDVALKKHRLSHSSIRPYKCSVCSKAFPMRYMVRDHERTHTGEKPFLCSLCGSSFGNRGHLYRHMRSHQLGTLHKRGRPRKFPQAMIMKINKKEVDSMGEIVETDGSELGMGMVEIKADHLQEVQEEIATSMIGPGPTYITVHTVDGQLSEQTSTEAVLGEGHLQHVVMETPDGMTDNVVLQVIRDLTGATAVYQQVTEANGVSTSQHMMPVGQQSQIIVSAAPHLVTQEQQIIVTTPHKTITQMQ